MYARSLTLALAALAFAAVLQAGAAMWALSTMNDHVLRGRIASDIELAFQELTVAKLRLRSWFTQAKLVPQTASDPARRFQDGMRHTLERLRTLSAQAIALDPDAATRAEHLQRQDALAVLDDSLVSLQAAVTHVRPLPAGTGSSQAWQAAGDLFDSVRGRDLRQLLADSIERESAAVARERAAADQAMLWMRRLLWATTATIAVAALLLAAGFARALRRPLDLLNDGAKALQQGNLAHRIPLEGPGEFAAVAQSMNTMAVELSEHRAREALARQQLAQLVAERTSELQSALDALQQVDARRRQLFADISHELRTPTTVIMGEAEITLRGGDRPVADYRAALQRIIATSRQLGSVIDDLLSMARNDIDTLTLNRRLLNLAEPLRQALEQAQALAHERGILVQGLSQETDALHVMADPQRLRQLLLLILDNAVRYSHPGGVVSLTVQRAPQLVDGVMMCEVRVLDHGIGIAAQDLPKVFDRSFRGQHARQHRTDGSGLGLAIGRALAIVHGGDISIESQPGRGTTVLLRLPLVSEPEQEALA